MNISKTWCTHNIVRTATIYALC